MKRRGRQVGIVSLFAFQDVMASIIGILFFVVLLMALDIVETTVPAVGQPEVADVDLQVLHNELNQLKVKHNHACTEVRQIADRVRLAGLGNRQILQEINELDQKLKAQMGIIQERQQAYEGLARNAKTKRKQLADKQKHLDERLSELKKLQQKLESGKGKSVANIAYIIDDLPDELRPWLVEVSKESIRVAAKDGSTSVFKFSGETPEKRRKGFIEWTRSQSKNSHYFVLLIKPSGMKEAAHLQNSLRRIGFQIGTDLLPETWKAFK